MWSLLLVVTVCNSQPIRLRVGGGAKRCAIQNIVLRRWPESTRACFQNNPPWRAPSSVQKKSVSSTLRPIEYFVCLLMKPPLQTLQQHSVGNLVMWSIQGNVKHHFTCSGCSNRSCTPEQQRASFQLKAIMELIVQVISGLLFHS